MHPMFKHLYICYHPIFLNLITYTLNINCPTICEFNKEKDNEIIKK